MLLGLQASLDGTSSNDADFSFLFNNPNLLLATINRCLQDSIFNATALVGDSFVEVVVTEDDLEADSISLQKCIGVSQTSSIKLSLEGLAIDDLSIINKFSTNFSSTATKFSLVVLDASNNNLKDNTLLDIFSSPDENNYQCQSLNTAALQRLNVSSNQLSSMLNLCSLSTRHLISLDVSFCEDLVVEPKCFVFCPQLRELHMDSCNIASTMHAELQGPVRSIFFGLVRLEELSLKENLLEDVESCEGLLYFGFDFFDSESHLPHGKAGPQLSPLPVSNNDPAREKTLSQLSDATAAAVERKVSHSPAAQSCKTTTATTTTMTNVAAAATASLTTATTTKAKTKGGTKNSSKTNASTTSKSSNNKISNSTMPSSPVSSTPTSLQPPSSASASTYAAAPVESTSVSEVIDKSRISRIAATTTAASSASLSALVPPASTLQRLFLRDNPVHSSLSLRRILKPQLLQSLPAIEYLDDEALRPPPSSSNATHRDNSRQVLRRREADDHRADLAGPLGPGGLDAMEREYLAALKGEKDNTVIS